MAKATEKNTTFDGVELDFNQLKYGDAGIMQGGTKAQIVDLFTRTIIAVPAEWGDPQDPETYTELPLKTGVELEGWYAKQVDTFLK